jgi:hypothetical protein
MHTKFQLENLKKLKAWELWQSMRVSFFIGFANGVFHLHIFISILPFSMSLRRTARCEAYVKNTSAEIVDYITKKISSR